MTNRPIINNNYVKYIEGSIPIIISAPHGGVLKPKGIPNRKKGVFEIDANTNELTHEIIEEFFAQTKNYPHTVIMNLSRKKVDANRDLVNATTNHPKAIKSYESFHNHIKNAKIKINNKFRKGLYIDIHGQSHTHKHIEFGYLLFNDTLKLSNEEIKEHQKVSSIKTLGNFSKHCFIEQLKGETSLSGLMNKREFKSIPSLDMPYAKCGNYFEGAYNTKTHGSLDNGAVSSIQAEFPYIGCRDTKENRKKTAKAFVESLIEYMSIHFGIDLKQ